MIKKPYEHPYTETVEIKVENIILYGGAGGEVDPIPGGEE